jgi:hypothetical protein
MDTNANDKIDYEVTAMFRICDILKQGLTRATQLEIEAIAGIYYFQTCSEAILREIKYGNIDYITAQFEKTPAPQNNSHWGMQNAE